MALVLGFQSSSNLAAAYGVAVTGTMTIDTILVIFVMLHLWRWSWPVVALVAGTFLVVDLAFFSANALKIPQGGWFPLAMGLLSFTVLTTWKRGRTNVFREIARQGMPLDAFLASIDEYIHRVSGTGVFLTKDRAGIPAALLHNLKHNKVLHERVVLVTVTTAEVPYVGAEERLHLVDLGKGFCRLEIRYGFMEQPDIPAAFAQCKQHGHEFEPMETSFFLSRETVIPSVKQGMALWREHLFALMTRNATSATEFFRIPTNRVVELGTQLEI
jgi:KUP system potassium uptake protein